MGCGPSTTNVPSSKLPAIKRRSTASVDSVEVGADKGRLTVRTRQGHPNTYPIDGYDVGLRVRVKGLQQSFFVGCARRNNEKITIKVHHFAHYPKDDRSAFNEIAILSKLSHPAIPCLAEVFHTAEAEYLIMDYIDPYRLWNFIDWNQEKSKISITDARFIMKSLTSAVQHCHDRGVIIRDLSPLNILVKKNYPPTNNNNNTNNNHTASTTSIVPLSDLPPYEVKIVDFSLAVNEGSTDHLFDHALFDWSMVPYCAPETLAKHRYSKAVDMWSLGVLLYVMISGRLPWEGYERNNTNEDHILIHNIQHAVYEYDGDIWKESGEGVKRLIGRLLQVNEQMRLSAKEVMGNSWINIESS